MTSPRADPPAAVPADPPDAGVAAHYGDPHGEQRAAGRGPAPASSTSRTAGVLRVSGPDRLTWLHSFTSQHLESLKPGVAVEALILSPQGRVEHALYLVDDGEATWFHVEPGTAPEILAFLQKMRFMMRVEPEDVTADYAAGPDDRSGSRRRARPRGRVGPRAVPP